MWKKKTISIQGALKLRNTKSKRVQMWNIKPRSGQVKIKLWKTKTRIIQGGNIEREDFKCHQNQVLISSTGRKTTTLVQILS